MRATHTILFLFLVLSIGASQSLAQNRHGGVDLDVVIFYRDSAKVKVEVYYSFLQKDIKLIEKESNRWSGDIRAKVTLRQNTGIIAARDVDKTIALSGTKEDISKNGFQYIIDVVPFVLDDPSNLLITVEIDLHDTSGKVYTEKLEKRVSIVKRNSSSTLFGGILLSSEMTQTDRNDSPFEKSGYYFTVNPSNTFGGEYSTLFFYTELSISDSLRRTADSLTLVTKILDPTAREIIRKTQKIGTEASHTPYIASFSIDGLPSDSYYLTITAENNSVVVAKTQKVFYAENDIILSEEEQGLDLVQLDEEMLFQSSDISKMTEGELTDKIAQASYILTDDIRKSFQKTNELAVKQRMFYDYWRKKDQPNTRPLSSYYEYFSKVEFANQKYSYQKTLGWKTDRGRVFIMYGPPDKIESELFSTQAKPYIQWQYIGRGYRLSEGSRGFFYFVDKMGGGNFTLVHSNVLGEVSNPNWYSMDALQIR